MLEGIVSLTGQSGQRILGAWKGKGECHRLPMEDIMEAFWGGVTPSVVVSGDAGGTIRIGSQVD